MEALEGCPHVVRLREAAFVQGAGAHPGAPPSAALLLMDYCPDTLVAHLQQQRRVGQQQGLLGLLRDAELLGVALAVARALQAMHSLRPPLAHRCVHAHGACGVSGTVGL